MAKAPDLSPRALSLVDKLLARLPASVSDLETWWERQGKVTRLELRRLLRQLDSDRLLYDRDAGTVRPMGTRPTPARQAPAPSFSLAALNRTVEATNNAVAAAILGHDLAAATEDAPPRSPLPSSVLDAGILTIGRTDKPAGPVTAMVGGVTFAGSAAAVKAATEAYQRALLSPPATPRPPAKPRQSKPVTGSVSERVRASVCRKPGTVGEVIGRFPDVNENTIRGALGTLKAKGLVGHTGGKYGAPRG